MPAHQEVERGLSNKRIPFVSGTGVATVTAANTNLSHQDIKDLIHLAEAEGHELVFTAGALKIRPKDSTL
jgi:hypothetical protein